MTNLSFLDLFQIKPFLIFKKKTKISSNLSKSLSLFFYIYFLILFISLLKKSISLDNYTFNDTY